MWENGVNLSWGSAAMWIAWVASVAMLGAGWVFGMTHAGQAGLGCSVIAGALAVIRDNARTRRVVRAVAREYGSEGIRVV